jgi:Ricin-type beta-trefoil lectin domain
MVKIQRGILLPRVNAAPPAELFTLAPDRPRPGPDEAPTTSVRDAGKDGTTSEVSAPGHEPAKGGENTAALASRPTVGQLLRNRPTAPPDEPRSRAQVVVICTVAAAVLLVVPLFVVTVPSGKHDQHRAKAAAVAFRPGAKNPDAPAPNWPGKAPSPSHPAFDVPPSAPTGGGPSAPNPPGGGPKSSARRPANAKARRSGAKHARSASHRTSAGKHVSALRTRSIKSYASNRCIDVAGGHAKDGTPLEILNCTGGARQKWTFESDGSLRSLGMCMDVAWASHANGAVIQLVRCNGGPAQKFVLNKAADLVNTGADKCVDVKDMKTANRTRLQLWSCGGTSNQKWHAV